MNYLVNKKYFRGLIKMTSGNYQVFGKRYSNGTLLYYNKSDGPDRDPHCSQKKSSRVRYSIIILTRKIMALLPLPFQSSSRSSLYLINKGLNNLVVFLGLKHGGLTLKVCIWPIFFWPVEAEYGMARWAGTHSHRTTNQRTADRLVLHYTAGWCLEMAINAPTISKIAGVFC